LVLGQSGDLIETEILEVDAEPLEQTDLEVEKMEAWDAEMESLRSLNTFCFRLHLAQGGLLFLLSFVNDTLSATMIPITSVFNDWSAGYPVPELDVVGSFTFLRYSSLFAILSAIAHYYVL
jgi:hypothetical protein